MLKITKLTSVSNLLKLIGSSAVVCWAYYTFKIYLMRRKYAHIPGPTTSGIWGFYNGNMEEIGEIYKQGKLMVDKFIDWHEKYGPVFKFQLAGTTFVFTSEKSAIKDIFITKNFPKPWYFMEKLRFPYGERFFGYGLVSEPDETRWRHRRAFFNPGFHRNVLMNFVEQLNTKADVLIEKLSKMADGHTVVNLFNEINRATLDAIALIAFGMSIDSINNENTQFSKTINESMKIVEALMKDPIAYYDPRKLKDKFKFKKLNRFLRETGREQIMKRLNAYEAQDSNLPNDILTNILKSNKENTIDIETMIDDFVQFFIAGQETTANTLGFCFLELGRHPRVLEKAREEINEVLGANTELTYQDVTKLKYCSSIFKEALRLYPPVANMSRITNEKMEINGYKIPSNTIVMASTYVNARSKKFYQNPDEFRPERFMNDSDTIESSVEVYTYFPFSLGPRNCIGQNFAKIEGIIMIAKLLQRFDYELDPKQSWNIEESLTIRPVDGSRCFLTLRS